MNVVLVFPSPFSPREALVQSIRMAAGEKVKIGFEGKCITCESGHPAELASALAGLFGADRIAVASKVSSQFSDLSGAIVDVGSKVVLPGQKFYVKVIQADPASYVDRDVEFVASGALAARLAEINARTAKSKQEADRVILALAGKESAYVCIQMYRAQGGLPSGLLGSISCSIHDPLSFLSCFAAAKAGFTPDIVLLYADEDELLENAKLVEILIGKTGIHEHTLSMAPFRLSSSFENVARLAKEQLALKILASMENSRITLPFSVAIHPLWFIESAMQDAQSAGKVPYMPMAFLPDDLEAFAKEAGLKSVISVQPIKVTKSEFHRRRHAIDSAAKLSLKRMKTLRLKVGPNYLHDILDSV